jgi:hypothetical protein
VSPLGAVSVDQVITVTFLVLGTGFLVANGLLGFQYARYLRRRRSALLTWRGPKPPYYAMQLAIGVLLGLILMYNVYRLYRLYHTVNFDRRIFGQLMMFLYYGYLFPLSCTIARGFYEDGIWADSRFIPYKDIGGIKWREGKQEVALIIISRLRNLARHLKVPSQHYGAARRLLRDKISKHDIHFSGTGLDLVKHDEREDI